MTSESTKFVFNICLIFQSPAMFADDTALYNSNENPTQIIDEIDNYLSKINNLFHKTES